MSNSERHTQNRVIRLFQERLGYRYLGNWQDRENNQNIEDQLLVNWLKSQGHSAVLIEKALYTLRKTAAYQKNKAYHVNREVYGLLRYGINVQAEVGHNKVTIPLIDWKQPLNNDFAIAEEVSVAGRHGKRPDIVLFVNGIALGVLELKRSTSAVENGIYQNIDNQKHLFIAPYFTTMQLLLAGNDSQGLRYGTTGTSAHYYLQWKEVNPEHNPNDAFLLKENAPIRQMIQADDTLLDKHITELLNKERLIELLHDFVVFDGGIKKLCRPNQYFGVKAAQEFVRQKKGGIIWHTQGSGKSLTMVWLTKWIREHNPKARVLIITDRTELDEQIERVFKGVDEDIYRTTSGADLIDKLNSTSPWLMCSLVHKFGGKEGANEGDAEAFLEEMRKRLPESFEAKGDIYVLVDECHRTQSGKLHSGMKELLPNALFMGFTGTPLLKKDKQTSLEVFGPYIHTYKFNEAVGDGVVLDLRYEARDIEQDISAHEEIDEWFDIQTRSLTDYAKAELKSRWGTIKKVFSAKSRLEKIVLDIRKDMLKLERLRSGKGNAMLVSDSVYNACRYYELFQQSGLKECAIVTSYAPSHTTIKLEDAGTGENEELIKYRIYQKMVADFYDIPEEKAANKVEEFEKEVKRLFVEEPGQMKLLIVVDKLLTGFDAPPATYLYIDKRMKDHGLFQAICRVNRLHGTDKEYGYIIDYKDLFGSLEQSIKDYTSEAFDAYDKEDVQGLLKDRLDTGKERLDDMLEAVRALCENVAPPKAPLDYTRYFVGDPENPKDIEEREQRRHQFYKSVAQLVRAYANVADDLAISGYPQEKQEKIKDEIRFYQDRKEEIMLASREKISLKEYEPGMRQLIDFYLEAKTARTLSKLEDTGLLELIVRDGQAALDELPEEVRKRPEAMAETIENNLRKVIIEEQISNPAYYEKMSTLLDELIRQRKQATQDYEAYLKELVELTKQVKKPETGKSYPETISSPELRALYDNLEENEALSLALDEEVKYKRKDAWREHKIRSREVRFIVEDILKRHGILSQDEVERIFELIKNQPAY